MSTVDKTKGGATARPEKRYRLWKKNKKTYYYKLPEQGWKTTAQRIYPQHAHNQRAIIDSYILKDEIAEKNIQKIILDDIGAFRRRLSKCNDPRAVIAVMAALEGC